MYVLAICTILCTVILFFICKAKVSNSNVIYDECISPILEKLGDNESITKDVLQYISNYNTKVQKNKDKNEKISYYNVNNDKIIIKDTQDLKDCSRLIQICHECVHSIQSKKILKMNYIFSNINILYFLLTFLYFFYNNSYGTRMILLIIQLFIFIVTFVLKIIVESDATYRATIVARDYLQNKVVDNAINEFIKKMQSEIYSIVPMFYFSLFIQGAMLLIINQLGAIFIK